MPQLPELVAAQWSEAKSALESSVRSGSQPGVGVDVDAILEKIAALIRSVGRQELQDVVRSGSTARPAPRVLISGGPGAPPAVGNPMVTTDIDSAADPATTLDTAAYQKVDPSGYLVEDTDPNDTAMKFKHGLTDGKTPTIDQTGEYSSDNQEFELGSIQAKADTKPKALANRKIPVVPGYEIQGVLGRGGMGVVYKASQLGLRRTVALKMILSGEHASPAQLLRFAAEARAVALIRHPGIVQIYEIGEHEGLPYFSLEFCSGGSLDKKLKHEPQPPRAAATLTEHLARAMSAAHAAGVVHRDLKPANVLLDAAGIPKITDFGLARELDDKEGQTRTGSVLGTPSYMSPEQALGLREVGPAADQYSLGATLYELLTGRPPFQGASIMETLEQVRGREPVPPSQLSPGCPKDLETICLKALQKEPAKRYASCEAMADDLHAFLEGRPISARPVGKAEKAWRWAKRNPRVAGLAAAVALLLLLLGTGGAIAAVVFDNKKREAEGLAEGRRVAQELAETKQREAEKARDDEAVARLNEQKGYDFTRETVFVALDEIPQALSQALFAGAAQQKILEALGAMLEKQLGQALIRGLPDRAMLNFHVKMGDLMTRTKSKNKGEDNRKKAEEHYRKSLAIADRLIETEEKEKDKAKGNRALILRKLGTLSRDAYADRGQIALDFFAEAAAIQRQVMDRPTSGEIPSAEAKASLAGTLQDIAETERRLTRYDRALPPCQDALKLWLEVVALPITPYTATAQQSLADSYIQIGRIRASLAMDEQADKDLAAGVAFYRKLLQASPANTALQVAAAFGFREYGDFLLMRNKLDAATPLHEWNLELTRGLLRTDEILAAQHALAESYYRTATLTLKKGDRPAADKLYRQCLDLHQAIAETRPTDVRQKIYVANAQARCGLHAEAAKTMEALAKQFNDSRFVIRQAAFTIAICVDAVGGGKPDDKLTEEEKKLREHYADRALTMIEDIVQRLGYADVVQLKTDPDLAAIQSHERLRAVVKKLASKSMVNP